MERIAGISQRTCTSSHFFFNNHILTKINLWLQLFNKTSGWDPSSKIYYLSRSFRSWCCSNSTGHLFILGPLDFLSLCTFHHPLTYFSFCSHFSELCYFLILYSAKICTYFGMCSEHLYDISPGFFSELFSHLYIVGPYHCIVLLDWPISVCHPSCVSFHEIFPKSTLDIFSFYSHRASSLLPLATHLLISLSLVYLHLNSCKEYHFLFFL